MIASVALALLLTAAGEFQVNSTTAGDQGYPSACLAADGSATVVWESRDATGSGLRGRRFDAAGAPLGDETALDVAGEVERQAPSVACPPDGGYLVVWEERGGDADDFDIGARRVATGGRAGEPFTVNATTAGRQRGAAVCGAAGGDFVVVWQGDEPEDGGYGIFLQRFAADGTRRGDERRVNLTVADEQRHPAVACGADGGVGVVWESRGEDGDGGAIVGRRFAADGRGLAELRLNGTTAGDQRHPAIAALADGGFLAAWESEGQDGDESAIVARRLAADLTPLGDELIVNSCAAYSQEQPAVAVGERGAMVVWSSPGDGEGYGIFARQLDAAGRPRGAEVFLNVGTACTQGAVSAEGGGLAAAGGGTEVLVAWQSLRLLGGGPDGDGLGVFARRATLEAPPCAGDCDGDGAVTIDELIRAVELALRDGSAVECAAIDADGDDRVVVAELIAAVAAALNGCESALEGRASARPSDAEPAFDGRAEARPSRRHDGAA